MSQYSHMGAGALIDLVQALRGHESAAIRHLMANELATFLAAKHTLAGSRPLTERDMLQLLARFQWIADLARLPEPAPREEQQQDLGYEPEPERALDGNRRFPDVMRDHAEEDAARPSRMPSFLRNMGGRMGQPAPTHHADDIDDGRR